MPWQMASCPSYLRQGRGFQGQREGAWGGGRGRSTGPAQNLGRTLRKGSSQVAESTNKFCLVGHVCCNLHTAHTVHVLEKMQELCLAGGHMLGRRLDLVCLKLGGDLETA